MNWTTAIISILVIVAVGAIMFKYVKIEEAIFGSGDDFESSGSMPMNVSVVAGALTGLIIFFFSASTNENIFAAGLSSIWCVLAYLLPCVAFAVISWGVYRIVMSESSVSRIVTRSLFLTFACLLGAIGGAVGSILAVVLIVIVFFGKLALKMMFDTSSSSSAPKFSTPTPKEDYDYTITDEMGFERKLKDVGLGKFRDDKGDMWKSDGANGVVRD